MYRNQKPQPSIIKRATIMEGETIEQKVARLVSNNEPITDGTPLIFTERNEGVKAEYNPRTDKWDIAVDGMDVATRARLAKGDNILQMPKKPAEGGEGGENTEGGEGGEGKA